MYELYLITDYTKCPTGTVETNNYVVTNFERNKIYVIESIEECYINRAINGLYLHYSAPIITTTQLHLATFSSFEDLSQNYPELLL